MGMDGLGLAGPILSVLGGLLEQRKEDVAAKTGLPADAVGKVGGAVQEVLGGDEKAMQAIMDEVDKARAHDTAMAAAVRFPLVDFLRGMVRPVITLTAFFWYVYARCTGLALSAEDYAIVGGIMAFWFGLRPFEKAQAAGALGGVMGVAARTLLRGK